MAGLVEQGGAPLSSHESFTDIVSLLHADDRHSRPDAHFKTPPMASSRRASGQRPASPSLPFTPASPSTAREPTLAAPQHRMPFAQQLRRCQVPRPQQLQREEDGGSSPSPSTMIGSAGACSTSSSSSSSAVSELSALLCHEPSSPPSHAPPGQVLGDEAVATAAAPPTCPRPRSPTATSSVVASHFALLDIKSTCSIGSLEKKVAVAPVPRRLADSGTSVDSRLTAAAPSSSSEPLPSGLMWLARDAARCEPMKELLNAAQARLPLPLPPAVEVDKPTAMEGVVSAGSGEEVEEKLVFGEDPSYGGLVRFPWELVVEEDDRFLYIVELHPDRPGAVLLKKVCVSTGAPQLICHWGRSLDGQPVRAFWPQEVPLEFDLDLAAELEANPPEPMATHRELPRLEDSAIEALCTLLRLGSNARLTAPPAKRRRDEEDDEVQTEEQVEEKVVGRGTGGRPRRPAPVPAPVRRTNSNSKKRKTTPAPRPAPRPQYTQPLPPPPPVEQPEEASLLAPPGLRDVASTSSIAASFLFASFHGQQQRQQQQAHQQQQQAAAQQQHEEEEDDGSGGEAANGQRGTQRRAAAVNSARLWLAAEEELDEELPPPVLVRGNSYRGRGGGNKRARRARGGAGLM